MEMNDLIEKPRSCVPCFLNGIWVCMHINVIWEKNYDDCYSYMHKDWLVRESVKFKHANEKSRLRLKIKES